MPEPKYNREDHLAAKDRGEQLSSSNTAQDLSEHINELRNRIIISILAFIAVFLICFYLSGPIVQFLEAAAPPGSSFFQLKPGELFISTLKVSVVAGLVISMPIWLKQLELFLRPGLKDKEIKIVSPILSFSPILFWTGMAFAYYLVLPPLLKFLLGFREGIVETRYGLEHFLNLEIAILVICGICFQLPIVLITLGHFNIITSSSLLKVWRYVVLVAFIISAIITPTPDPFTMSILALAILGLYFGTVVMLKFLTKPFNSS